MTDMYCRGRFLVDSRPHPSAFGMLTRWTVDDLDTGETYEGLAADAATANAAAMTALVNAR